MTRLIYGATETRLESARVEGDALWLDKLELEQSTRWSWKSQGLCRDDTCLPIPHDNDRPWVSGDRFDVAALWRYLEWPIVRSRAGDVWVLGECASRRAAPSSSLSAPDFALPDLDGRLHRLSDYRGRKVFLVTWASWCGCRAELPKWQSLHEELSSHGFTVLAVALDEPGAARPWIDAASPGYPCLVDRGHVVAELYNLVNVPEAIWIDEAGSMVRPPEPAGMLDSFRAMDRATFALPAPARAERDRAKAAYLDAVRDWAIRGAGSQHALGAEAVIARLKAPAPETAEAHSRFRLGQALLRDGRADEAAVEFAEAIRLHPDSWAMWRQTADRNPSGLAVSEAFWRRVDALGERHYYEPTDLTHPRVG
ncbi:MAG TPA: redoxin domain-containing protein [Polyangiaceae bacterium]|nr:redoxin domain-containing protein [Polyangiaceae bacterium]